MVRCLWGDFVNSEGYGSDLALARLFGIPVTTLRNWRRAHGASLATEPASFGLGRSWEGFDPTSCVVTHTDSAFAWRDAVHAQVAAGKRTRTAAATAARWTGPRRQP
jgi:hypothetical protein